MKKLKMIATSFIVLAIVSSAFAFKAKKAGSFCVSNATPDTDCFIVHGVKVVSGTINYFYQQNWDGDPATCNHVGSGGNCGTSVRLIGD